MSFDENYVPLSLKFRPRTWADVVGQEHAIEVLTNSLETGRIFHSYIFDGVAGCGKTSAARIFAMALNCEKLEDNSPCLVCTSCTEALALRNTDILEIDGPSNAGVADVRELRTKVTFSPAHERRVIIIDEVHALTRDAWQALLKLLEEPPSHVVFILATTNPESIPATIHSRSIRLSFRRHTEKNVVERLMHIANRENIGLPESSALLIARFADGQLRDSVTTLEQLHTTSRGRAISPEMVAEALGIVSGTELNTIMTAVLEADAVGLEKAVSNTLERSNEFGMLVRNITDWYRDVLRVKHGAAEVVRRSETDKVLLARFAEAMNFAQLDAALRLTWEMSTRVRFTSSMPKTFFLTGLYQLMYMKEMEELPQVAGPPAPVHSAIPTATTAVNAGGASVTFASNGGTTAAMEEELKRLTQNS
jgi:DNA polymerase-3 subunit gamma/tau